MVPVHPRDQCLLGVQWGGNTYRITGNIQTKNFRTSLYTSILAVLFSNRAATNIRFIRIFVNKSNIRIPKLVSGFVC